MVSILLLTTEEVLASNTYWCRLGAVWVTEDLEPFEDVRPEDLYVKPLSRDSYYAKFPDIARSESEDENSMTLTGFKDKYCQWRSKIYAKRINAERRNSSQLNYSGKTSQSNPSYQEWSTRRLSSVSEVSAESNAPENRSLKVENNDDKVRAFFTRLLESVPPPPIQELQDTVEAKSCSILEGPNCIIDFNSIDVPNDYSEFESDKIAQKIDGNSLPRTSTLKRRRRRSCSLRKRASYTEFEHCESWYETIYGVTDLILKGEYVSESDDDGDDSESLNLTVIPVEPKDHIGEEKETVQDCEYFESWSEVLSAYDDESFEVLIHSDHSPQSSEQIISQSHYGDMIIKDIDESLEADDETGYARFAIYKIYQTLKLEDGICDSSSMKEFKGEDEENYDPPENELQKNSDRVLSEHELRVQRSLQKLNVPEWYKNAPTPREGFLLRKRLSDASSATRWGGLNSKTTSLGSLGAAQPPPPQLSPHTTSFGRWSTSRLNSNQTSPCSSTRSSIRGGSPLCSPSGRSSFSARQPYLGWRSQERLNTTPRTPHERYARLVLSDL
ncbi:unnamed protein product [Plutella xylostella]|uniref:(diamondback moth) hypothetical protein n=1 Tax=Plutella xylostella TaxID=51655 RepID=A0A8S4E4L9_PLUXY|nr:unnamed protein product [Plutella xylostella]